MDAVDRVIITTLIDNYVDVFIPGTKNVERWGPPELVQGATVSYATTPPLIAEHGLSLLIETFREDQKQTYLFDAGFTKDGVPHNIEKLGVDLNKISSIVISHGHPDHTGALAEILKTAEKKIPVITHPSAFLKRYLVFPDGTRVLSNTFTEKALDDAGAEVLLSGDLAILGPGVVATGEIDMVNDFEQHFPLAYYEQNGEMEKDFFPDEKSLIINLKDKGLIVLSGCGHRGIINTVEYAKRATGIEQVHAVIGGFHLTGTTPMEKIERTVEEMKRIEPDFIIPTHCTGWKAMNRFADEMSDNFLLNAVGTRFILA
jgi:7,8-dihydropterin-6-yl-methyl-4-(beta-D-ribofuranosyl)aminobenzene 5'-phosphate synthase